MFKQFQKVRSKSDWFDNAYLHKMFGYMYQECSHLHVEYSKKDIQYLLTSSAALVYDLYYDMSNIEYAFDVWEKFMKLREQYVSCYLEYRMITFEAQWIDDPEAYHDEWYIRKRLKSIVNKQSELLVETVGRFIELLPMLEVMIPLMNYIRLDYNVGEVVTKYYAHLEDETVLDVIQEHNRLRLALVVLKYFRKMKLIPMKLYMKLKKTCLRVMKLLYPDQVGSFYSLVSIVGHFVGNDGLNKHVVPYYLAYLPALEVKK